VSFFFPLSCDEAHLIASRNPGSSFNVEAIYFRAGQQGPLVVSGEGVSLPAIPTPHDKSPAFGSENV
jgi:hypothetical protein